MGRRSCVCWPSGAFPALPILLCLTGRPPSAGHLPRLLRWLTSSRFSQRGRWGIVRGSRRGEARGVPFSLPASGDVSSRGCLLSLLHGSCFCWVTHPSIPSLVMLEAACSCSSVGRLTVPSLASYQSHHLCSQFPVLNSLCFQYSELSLLS